MDHSKTLLFPTHCLRPDTALAMASSGTVRAARCVEVNPDARAYFEQSLAVLKANWQHAPMPPPELSYRTCTAAAAVLQHGVLDRADCVVLDPPRKGVEPALLDVLCDGAALPTSVKTLLYLSCGFKALQRDCDRLLASGEWTLGHAEAFVFFPGTDALETLVCFSRRQS